MSDNKDWIDPHDVVRPENSDFAKNIFGTPPKVVRSIGDLKQVTVDGKKFYRQPSIHIQDMGTTLCAPYDNHFVFMDARRRGWTLFCTCGSIACVVGYDAYKNDASPQGQLLVCYYHAATGKHTDGSN